MKNLVLILLILSISILFAGEWQHSVSYDFADTLFQKELEIRQDGGREGPKFYDDTLVLVEGGRGRNHRNAVVFPVLTKKVFKETTIEFDLLIRSGSEGFGIALLNAEEYKANPTLLDPISWEAPSIARSFGVGFDISNPQTSSWFDEFGNYYNREEREISLHWDGLEIHK